MKHYRRRYLSNPVDMLPALSGIAVEYDITFKTKTIAGILHSDILGGLMWTYEREKT
jgi:hypothetical protein